MLRAFCYFAFAVVSLPVFAFAQDNAAQPPAAKRKAAKRSEPIGPPVRENKATPIERLKAMLGFQAELLYSVPGGDQGSWVNLCTDDKGRIIASDQYGGLYRFAPPAAGQPLDPASIEKVPAEIRAANGLLWAFGALYVGVNDYENKIESGLYRVTDSDGDDKLDKVEMLRSMKARGDHGVHAVLLSPDGGSLFVVTGNGTTPTEFNSSRVPTVWGEDHLLPRMPDGRGFMREVLAPGGIIYRVSPDGQNWEVYSSGYRNIFDAAFNRDGELFTYDADMEYDFNTSWYRPTRVCHVTSGSEYGWRNGAGKRPEFYPDNLPAVINIGPGSPTGVTFGYGAKFPAKYQEALYILDWSWGKVYAVHLQPNGSTYTATKEEFLTGMPLPITDAIIHPGDGAMYFAIGGRKVQSGLYRVTYTGTESTVPVKPVRVASEARDLRHRMENYHRRVDEETVRHGVPLVKQHLASSDRFLRWAVRTAIEHQDPAHWADVVFAETDVSIQLELLLGLARVTGIDPFHRKPADPPVDTAMQSRLLDALAKIHWDQLTNEQRMTLVRTYEIVLNRFGRPDDAAVARIISQLDPHFPAPTIELNWLLCETLVFLQSPTVAAKAMVMIHKAPTQEEQIEYARSLRMLKAGWTPETRAAYFQWLNKAASSYRGGASFEKFVEFIRTDAVATLSDGEKETLKDLLEQKIVKVSPLSMLENRPTVKQWTLDDLVAPIQSEMKKRSFENGRKMFATAACFACHRFGNEGGSTGPDLTSAGRRYSPHDLVDQIVNPSKVINEQFAPVNLVTTEGKVITGVIVNLSGDSVQVNTDGTDPNQRVGVDRKLVESIEPSRVSPMPQGLLNSLTKDDILDLVAYVVSGGDAKNELFKK